MKKLPVKAKAQPFPAAQKFLATALWMALLFMVMVSIRPASADAGSVLEELKSCAKTADDSARIACYEALGKSVLAAEAGSAAEASVAASDTSADDSASETGSATSEAPTQAETKADAEVDGSLPDGIGGGEFARAAGIPQESYRGKVKSCKKGLDKKWFYIFEGGQIWKQSDNRKRSYKAGCDFYVTLLKDAFGYVMTVDGEDRSTRISRFR